MPSQLPTPADVDLYGASAAEKERSRRHDEIKIGFTPVTGADAYEVRVDGIQRPGFVLPGDWVVLGLPNTAFALELRAVGTGKDPSDWSGALRVVTRPPSPPAPQREPYDLQGWGIVISWSVKLGDWPGAGAARVELLRAQGDGSPEVLRSEAAPTDRHIDTTYEKNVLKRYILRTMVPQGAVPDDLLGGRNTSFEGPPLEAMHPHTLGASLAPLDVGMRNSERDRLLAALYGIGGVP